MAMTICLMWGLVHHQYGEQFRVIKNAFGDWCLQVREADATFVNHLVVAKKTDNQTESLRQGGFQAHARQNSGYQRYR